MEYKVKPSELIVGIGSLVIVLGFFTYGMLTKGIDTRGWVKGIGRINFYHYGRLVVPGVAKDRNF